MPRPRADSSYTEVAEFLSDHYGVQVSRQQINMWASRGTRNKDGQPFPAGPPFDCAAVLAWTEPGVPAVHGDGWRKIGEYGPPSRPARGTQLPLTDKEIAQRTRARSKVQQALKTGKLMKPEGCSYCGKFTDDLHAHHPHGYDDNHALDVHWACSECHGKLHTRNM